MLDAQTRLSNFELERRSEIAFGAASKATSDQDMIAEQILARFAAAKKVVMEKLVEGYGARRIEIPSSVWIAGSPIEAADMLRRPGVEVVLMPTGQSLVNCTAQLQSQLPALDPMRGIPTSWSLNLQVQGDRKTTITDAEPVFTEMVVGGQRYTDPQNKVLIANALGLLAVCQLAHPESNNWQLGLTREDHTSARSPHIHRGEISAVLGAVGPGVQIKKRLLVDGSYTDLFVPPHVAAFFKGPRQFGGSQIFSRYGTPHQTPKPDNTCFPYEKRLAVVCYASDKNAGEQSMEPRQTTTSNYLEIYTRHLSNWFLKLSPPEIELAAKSFINLE
jgi:hypothetical protein